MLWKRIDLEKRSENEPKFNSKNKTDRKIVGTVLLLVAVLLVLIVGCFVLYYAVWR